MKEDSENKKKTKRGKNLTHNLFLTPPPPLVIMNPLPLESLKFLKLELFMRDLIMQALNQSV
jgi:hypothetical protein